MIGQTISHYKILEKLGEGGMGIVYRAEDTKLKRTVALKFLPDRVNKDSASKARFLQEAQAAAGLNHPNICTIHGVEDVDGSLFMVMEYIEGGTLSDKIPYRNHDEAVTVASQIGEALQEAHSKGIVHRDIKTDNVMLTSKGQAKVMDFGLAKLKGALKLTRTSSTVGTLGYMAPEQIQGGEVDHRSDIFSFGVLLFEMLTGKLPFRGEHEAAMVYSIVNEEPQDIGAILPDLSPLVANLITRCLEKDPADRYQTMQDAVSELRRSLKKSSPKVSRQMSIPEGAVPSSATLPAIAAAQTAPVYQRTSFRIAAVVVVLVVAVVAIFMMKEGSPVPTKGETSIRKFTSLPGLEDEPTWSPDGKFLAYVTDDRGNFDIVVQPADGGRPIRVANTDAEEIQPAWSPDGAQLAFVSARDHGGRLSPLLNYGILDAYLKGTGGDIFLVPALGGNPVKLVSNGFDPAWSPDGKTIVFRSVRSGDWELWTIRADGGEPKQLTNDIGFEYQPSWSPDGKSIVCVIAHLSSPADLYVISSSGGHPQRLTYDKTLFLKPGWSPDGKSILFSSRRSGSMNIWQIPFFSGAQDVATPKRVTVGEGADVNLSVSSIKHTISYATVKSSPDIWELTVSTGMLRQVSTETGLEDQPIAFPDGKVLLVQSDRGGNTSLWTMDLNGTFLSQVVEEGAGGASLSPDGKSIAYLQQNEVAIRAIGDVSLHKVIPGAGSFPCWSPDAKMLAFSRGDGSSSNIWTHAVETGAEKQITSFKGAALFPDWSPDGERIVFSLNKGNSRHLWMVPSSGGTSIEITSGGSEYSHPKWSPTEKNVILCLKDHRDICLVNASTGKVRELRAFTESGVNLIDYPSWSPDGKKIYFSLYRKTGDIYVLENY